MDFVTEKINIDMTWELVNSVKVTFSPDCTPWYSGLLDLCETKQKLNSLRHYGTNWHKILHDLDNKNLTGNLHETVYSFMKAKITLRILDYYKKTNPELYDTYYNEAWGSAYKDGYEYLYEKQLDKDTYIFHYRKISKDKRYERHSEVQSDLSSFC